MLQRVLVEFPRLLLDLLRLPAHRVQAHGSDHPMRRVLDEAFDVLAADEGNMLAELVPVEVDQHPPVSALFLRHLVEHLGGSRILVPQPMGVIQKYPRMLLLQRDRQGHNLLFFKVGELFHGRSNG